MLVEFVRWGSQCPWADWAEDQVRAAAGRAGAAFRPVDLTTEAYGQAVWFPFQWFLDGRLVTPSPVPEEAALGLILRGVPSAVPGEAEAPLPPALCTEVRPLDALSLADSCRVCRNGDPGLCGKDRWFADRGPDLFGLVGYQDGEPVALAEAVPAARLPYGGFDRRPDTAALVCVYSNHDRRSYQADLLERVAREARDRGFRRLQAVCGRRSAHPNGPEAEFLAAGFVPVRDLGEVSLAGRGVETLVLVERLLTGA